MSLLNSIKKINSCRPCLLYNVILNTINGKVNTFPKNLNKFYYGTTSCIINTLLKIIIH